MKWSAYHPLADPDSLGINESQDMNGCDLRKTAHCRGLIVREQAQCLF